MKARDRYPNLAALATYGHVTEWPEVKDEARLALDELDRLHDLMDEGVEPRPDYLGRAVVAAVIVILIAWALGLMRLGGGVSQ